MAKASKINTQKAKKQRVKSRAIISPNAKGGKMPLISLRGYALDPRAIKKLYDEAQQDLEETRRTFGSVDSE